MPITLNGETYYGTAEACRIVGISKNTFLRWVKNGTFADVRHRDRRGWRLFTRDDLGRLRAEVHRVERIQVAQEKGVASSINLAPE